MVRVPASSAEIVAQRLMTPYKSDIFDPSVASMTWNRYSVRPGDDEEVVSDLWRALGGLAEAIDLTIDWQASDY